MVVHSSMYVYGVSFQPQHLNILCCVVLEGEVVELFLELKLFCIERSSLLFIFNFDAKANQVLARRNREQSPSEKQYSVVLVHGTTGPQRFSPNSSGGDSILIGQESLGLTWDDPCSISAWLPTAMWGDLACESGPVGPIHIPQRHSHPLL